MLDGMLIEDMTARNTTECAHLDGEALGIQASPTGTATVWECDDCGHRWTREDTYSVETQRFGALVAHMHGLIPGLEYARITRNGFPFGEWERTAY